MRDVKIAISQRLPKICKPLSGLSILMPGFISLPDATSYETSFSFILVYYLYLIL